MPSDHAAAFVAHIAEIAESPGTRAALRSGLGRPPAQCYRLHPYVARWIAEDARPDREAAFYAVAALIAHEIDQAVPETPPRNLGASLALASISEDTAQRYLHLVTRQPSSAVSRYVMEIAGTLRSQRVPIDFAQLLDDLLAWPWRQQEISKRWMQAYYRGAAPAETDKEPA